MVNILADYQTAQGKWGYNEFQVTITDSSQVACKIVHSFLREQGNTPKTITVVHGTYSMKQLKKIHESKEGFEEASKGNVFEVFSYA